MRRWAQRKGSRTPASLSGERDVPAMAAWAVPVGGGGQRERGDPAVDKEMRACAVAHAGVCGRGARQRRDTGGGESGETAPATHTMTCHRYRRLGREGPGGDVGGVQRPDMDKKRQRLFQQAAEREDQPSQRKGAKIWPIDGNR